MDHLQGDEPPVIRPDAAPPLLPSYPWTAQQVPTIRPRRPKSKSDKLTQVLTIVVCLIFVGCSGLLVLAVQAPKAQPPKAKKPSSPGDVDVGTLNFLSQKIIRLMLKHPDDAKFEHPDGGERSFLQLDFKDVMYSKTRYGIRGRVKAPNDFGAALTYRWECIWDVPDFDVSKARLSKVIYDGKTVFPVKE